MNREPQSRQRKPLSAGFIGVIVFKYLKAMAFAVVGIAVLRIARLSRHGAPMEVAAFLGVDPNRESVRRVSEFLSQITPGQVEAIGLAALFIGAVFAAEGTLLAARLWWATYLTVFLTALGIPVEVREIAHHPGKPRVYLLLAINVAILLYVWVRRNEFRNSGPD